MNYIVACLYFHAGQVLAYELAIRILNDYHLKEVVMHNLPGLTTHTDVTKALMKELIPDLHEHLTTLNIDIAIFC